MRDERLAVAWYRLDEDAVPSELCSKKRLLLIAKPSLAPSSMYVGQCSSQPRFCIVVLFLQSHYPPEKKYLCMNKSSPFESRRVACGLWYARNGRPVGRWQTLEARPASGRHESLHFAHLLGKGEAHVVVLVDHRVLHGGGHWRGSEVTGATWPACGAMSRRQTFASRALTRKYRSSPKVLTIRQSDALSRSGGPPPPDTNAVASIRAASNSACCWLIIGTGGGCGTFSVGAPLLAVYLGDTRL